MDSKRLCQHSPIDERPSPQLMPEGESAGIDVVGRQRHRGREMTEQGIHRRAWYLPTTEETEYVIDSHCSEILLHPLQALLPPSASLAHHGIPIVCGEAPVLPLGVSLVGHRSRLHVEIEQRALAPCLYTVGTYSYGYV